ncbi:MAG: hypothetical protein C0515_03840 [Novosphingobium sp.]|nr:hypothetical protein [Novosphingobium sp.]
MIDRREALQEAPVRHTPATILCDSAIMDTQQATFDWIAWYASIPGVPAGWGASPAVPVSPLVADELVEAEMPLLEAA